MLFSNVAVVSIVNTFLTYSGQAISRQRHVSCSWNGHCLWRNLSGTGLFRLTIVSFCCRWRGGMILAVVPKSDWPQVRNKCAAMDSLAGRRKEWGCRRNWYGNYLSLVSVLVHCMVLNQESDKVATNLENSGNLKSCQNLRENSGKFEIWTWKTRGKWKICDMITNKNALRWNFPSWVAQGNLKMSRKSQGKLREFSFSKIWSLWVNAVIIMSLCLCLSILLGRALPSSWLIDNRRFSQSFHLLSSHKHSAYMEVLLYWSWVPHMCHSLD